MSRLHLCLNCLEPGAKPVDVGPDMGTQRDPYRCTVDLCGPCRDALLTSDLAQFHRRHSSERIVTPEDR